MKKTFLLLLFPLFLCACNDEEIDYNDGITRYTVIGKVPSLAANLISTVTIYEYSYEDVRIDSSIIEDPSSGHRYVFEANELSSHLKVKLISKAETYRWGDTIIMLRPGKNVNITISATSPTRMTEPMLNEKD